MNYKSVERYVLSLAGSKLGHPFGKELSVFSINDKMFAIIEIAKKPLRLSLRCDKQLAAILKDRYEEVMPGHKLNKDQWITIVVSGQLDNNEITGLINHSYNLVLEES